MTQKMLEAAAKACGFKKWRVLTSGLFQVSNNENWNEAFAKWTGWNPLTNNADCAAMCARLMIETVWFPCHMACEIVTDEDKHIWHISNYIDHNNDRESAWRFAATMVAAKIGGME